MPDISHRMPDISHRMPDTFEFDLYSMFCITVEYSFYCSMDFDVDKLNMLVLGHFTQFLT